MAAAPPPAPVSPQEIRDRLLRAVDGQRNIRDMAAVVEVISFLEQHCITIEALEETRLGKLINDIRKKTKNESLAGRAKKLLRNWQKLIEPGGDDVLPREHTGASWSTRGGILPCVSVASGTTSSCKMALEVKIRSDFNNCHQPRHRKHKGDHNKEQFLPAKAFKTTMDDTIQNTNKRPHNEIENCTNSEAYQLLHKDVSEPVHNGGLPKIVIDSVKPQPIAPRHSEPLNTSCLQKSLYLQQQCRQENTATGRQYQPKGPHCSLHTTLTQKQRAGVKQTAPSEKSQTVRPRSSGTFGLAPSSEPLSYCVQGPYSSRSADLDSQCGLPDMTVQNCSSYSSNDNDIPFSDKGERKTQKYRPEDYVVNIDKSPVENRTKPVRLKDSNLISDSIIGQIEPPFHKSLDKAIKPGHQHCEPQWSEQPKENPIVPPSLLHQTDWRELSMSAIVQSYFRQHSRVLMSSVAQTPISHFFTTEFLEKEKCRNRDPNEAHTLAAEMPVSDLPGITRQVTHEDLSRLNTQHWSGVNGCYDTKGTWYDWTQSISLDPHGDGSRLNILPYVCLD